MSNLNYTFFEEYKRLDKLCGELYNDQYGISHYIEDMRNISGNDFRSIPGWKDDLDRLIRLRHIRNYLAHTEGAFQEENCTEKDIEWIQEFHRRILNQSDPLAMLYQYSKTKQQARKSSLSPSKPQPPQPSPDSPGTKDIGNVNLTANRRKRRLYWIIVSILIAGFLFLVILDITGLLG